jgi:hypothetical protein
LTGNATSTLTQFNGGFTAFASSTIGDGTQIGGVTINGGATTTLTAYFAGNVGIGTSTPWAMFSVASSTYNFSLPLFSIATSSGSFGQLVMASASSTAPLPGVRFGIGTSTLPGAGIGENWTLTAAGPIYSTYASISCENTQSIANLTNDSTVSSTCNDFLFDADTQGAVSSQNGSTLGVSFNIKGAGFAQIWAGSSAAATAAVSSGSGGGLVPPGANTGAFTASSSPIFEAMVAASSTNATSTIFIVGFRVAGFGSDEAPSDGILSASTQYMFVATSTDDWIATAKDNGSAYKQVDTGVSSTTATGVFQKMRIVLSTSGSNIISTYFINDIVVAQLSTPPVGLRQPINPLVSVGARSAGLAKTIGVGYVKAWWNRAW